jgi:hypothetical protein
VREGSGGIVGHVDCLCLVCCSHFANRRDHDVGTKAEKSVLVFPIQCLRQLSKKDTPILVSQLAGREATVSEEHWD